jgi:hypothetical protein
MSTGCAVLFGGNIYGFFIFPLGGTTDFLGRFFKSIINAIYVSKKYFFFGHCKNHNKSEKQQKHFYVEKMVATCSFELVWAQKILTRYAANFQKSEKIFYGNIDGALMMLFKKRPKKSVMPPSRKKGNSKCSHQKASLNEC